MLPVDLCTIYSSLVAHTTLLIKYYILRYRTVSSKLNSSRISYQLFVRCTRYRNYFLPRRWCTEIVWYFQENPRDELKSHVMGGESKAALVESHMELVSSRIIFPFINTYTSYAVELGSTWVLFWLPLVAVFVFGLCVARCQIWDLDEIPMWIFSR